MRRSRLVWITLAVVTISAVAMLALGSDPGRSLEARAERIDRKLACPVCTGETVADSNAPQSRAIRIGVLDRLRRGETERTIIAHYVSIYGDRVVLTPSTAGLDVLAWVIPVMSMVIGAAAIALAMRRWARQPRLSATDDDMAVVTRARTERPHDR
jgi:cytochrome c-type biogenesis protein CcmH